MAEANGACACDLCANRGVSEVRNVRAAYAIAPLGGERGKPHSRGAWVLNDAEMRKGLGSAPAAINEFQTQTELVASLGFFDEVVSTELLDLGTRVAKLINALLGVLQPESEPANRRRD